MSIVFCIIPAFNEEKNIVRVVLEVVNYVDCVVVVNDASYDKTLKVLKKANFSDKVILLSHLVNRGQGAALETGNEYARRNGARVVVHFDADGQFLASEIPDLLEPIMRGEAEVVFGSRFLGKQSQIPILKKNILLPLGRVVNRLFVGKNTLTDPQSGFRVLSFKVLSELRIEQDRMAHCTEIIDATLKAGYKTVEIPIKVIYNKFGQKFGGGVNILKDLILKKILY